MPNLGSIIESAVNAARESVPKIGAALTEKPVPALAERLANPNAIAEQGAKLPPPVVERAVGVPSAAPEGMRPLLRTTENYPHDVGEWVQERMRDIRGLFQANPDLPVDLDRKFIDARHETDTANNLASQMMHHVYDRLKENPIQQAQLVMDHAVAADDYSQALSDKYDTIRKYDPNTNKVVDVPVNEWKAGLDKLQEAVHRDPQVLDASQKRTEMWSSLFDDMVKEGAIIPERERDAYTPMRHLSQIAKGLANVTGDNSLLDQLASVQKRKLGGGVRETNLLSLEHQVISKYLRWKADKRMFANLMEDKSINLTDQFPEIGRPLPRNLTRYSPGPGQPGYQPAEPEAELLSGIGDVLQPQKRITQREYVIPKAVARALGEMHTYSTSQSEAGIREFGRSMAKFLTVYNPANMAVNIPTDLMVAMMGEPGERAHPLGVLKYYGPALKAATEGVFKDKSTYLKIGNQIIDVWDLVKKEGVGTTTFMSQIKGGVHEVPRELQNLIPEAERSTQGPLFQAQEMRQATELAPRIAAGLEALERTGDPKEFGRIARLSTLEYGAGAPLASRLPIYKLIAPFIQWFGLASQRVHALATTPGSRLRTFGTIAAVPTTIYLWNNQNDAYKKVSDALPARERGQCHIIIPDSSDPSKPKLDVTGKPVVLRFRYSVPEEIMKTFGLGNMPERITRVVQQKDTPKEFAQQTVQNIGENLGSLITMPDLVGDILHGTDPSGKPLDAGQKIMRTIPFARIINEGWTNTKDYGPKAGAVRLAEAAAGLSFANVSRKGNTLMDATLQEHIRSMNQAKSSMIASIRDNKSPTQQEKARKDFEQAKDDLIRYVKARNSTRKLQPDEVQETGKALTEGSE